MLRPNFLLTKKVLISISRTSQGSYLNGDWVDGIEATIERNVNIQPLKYNEVLQLPESERTRDWYKVYSDEDLRSAREGVDGYAADEFDWEGSHYRVMKVQNYSIGILNHWKALAARVEITQGSI